MPKYIVTDGIRYLRQDGHMSYYFTAEQGATVWKTSKQALNAMNNSISAREHKTFFVAKANKKFDIREIIQRLVEADTSNFDCWFSGIGSFWEFVNDIDTIKSGLLSVLSEIDEEVCDILHYVEFGRLNASQGWAASEMIKAARIRRRKVKDLLYIIQQIQSRSGGVSEVESAKNAIVKLNQRVYKPRKLDFLFEDRKKLYKEGGKESYAYSSQVVQGR